MRIHLMAAVLIVGIGCGQANSGGVKNTTLANKVPLPRGSVSEAQAQRIAESQRLRMSLPSPKVKSRVTTVPKGYVVYVKDDPPRPEGWSTVYVSFSGKIVASYGGGVMPPPDPWNPNAAAPAINASTIGTNGN